MSRPHSAPTEPNSGHRPVPETEPAASRTDAPGAPAEFVLLSPRPGAEVCAAEYRDFLAFAGLEPHQLEQRILDTEDADVGRFEGVTGVFIGGSPFTITDPETPALQDAVSTTLVRFVSEHLAGDGLPIFSTCYGAGMLAHYLDGEVSQKYAEPAGATVVELTDAASQDPICRELPPAFTALCGHKDSVVRLPSQATLLAGSPRCPVQFYRLGETVWVSQFHPELDPAAIVARLKFYLRHGYTEEGKEEETFAAVAGVDTRVANSILPKFVAHARQLRAQRG